LKFWTVPKLLIIDEIGSLLIEPHGAYLFFQLISRRYAPGAIILVANHSSSQWASELLPLAIHHDVGSQNEGITHAWT
jgi:DNA replication protein DnaC